MISEPAGRAIGPAGKVSEPCGRALEVVGRASEAAGRHRRVDGKQEILQYWYYLGQNYKDAFSPS